MTTPTIQELLKAAFDHEIANIHTALPGHIVKYDPKLQKAEVMPDIQKKYYNGKVTDMPIITNVPIVFPRSSEAFIKFPLKKNDGVLLIFSERALERWLSVGGIVEPGSNRKFDISDCIAIPGLYSFANPIDDDSDNFIIKYKEGAFVINPDNKMAFGNNEEELIDLITELIGDIKTLTYGGHPIDPGSIVTLDDLLIKFAKIKGVL